MFRRKDKNADRIERLEAKVRKLNRELEKKTQVCTHTEMCTDMHSILYGRPVAAYTPVADILGMLMDHLDVEWEGEKTEPAKLVKVKK